PADAGVPRCHVVRPDGDGHRHAAVRLSADHHLPARHDAGQMMPDHKGKAAMNGRVQDRTALVMGAGSIGPGWGNGKAIAVTLARQGARVMCVDRDPAAAEETAALIAAEGGTAVAHVADATSSDQVAAVRDACVDRFGSIDILVNNIGIAPVGGVVELSVEDW